MIDTLKDLCALSGVSGWEDEVRDYILLRAMSAADRIETDPIGNLYALKKGKTRPRRPVMLCAHMDEAGLIVTGADEEGFLRFDTVGSPDLRGISGKKVFVGPDRIPGVIGLKPKHLSTEEEMTGRLPAPDELRIDIGAETGADADALVRPGWRAVFDSASGPLGTGAFRGRALDGRAGCAALLKLMETGPTVDTWFVFTAQKEVGSRGAGVAADRIGPGFAMVLDGLPEGDGEKDPQSGSGIVIPYMDRGTIYDRDLWNAVTAAADRSGIAWQTASADAERGEAAEIQRRREGCRVITLSVAVRNFRCPSVIGRISDLTSLPVLCETILEDTSIEY